MRIPFWSRLRLAPRIAIVIVLTLVATTATDKIMGMVIGMPDVLFFEKTWLVDTVAETVQRAEQTDGDEWVVVRETLPAAQWLDFVETVEPSITNQWEQDAFGIFREDLARRLGVPVDDVLVRTVDTEGPERALTPIVIILESIPMLITNLIDDNIDKMVVEHMRIAVRLSSGGWLTISPKSDGLEAARFVRNLLVPIAAILLICGLSIWVARSIARPLTDLSAAAERLGRDREPTLLGNYGSPELEAIADSFNEMQHELKRFVDDRLQMVAAISHDLRTPLTRLRLFAEYLPDQEQRRMVLADIGDMEAIVSSTMTFASHQLNKERTGTVDLASLLISICDTASDAGGTVTYVGPDHAPVSCQPVAIRRAFTNLIDNGCKYATSVRVTLNVTAELVRVTVSDDGPGIPAEQVEAALRPFVRLEASRNRDTGGSGLGLTIADEVVRAHSGMLTFAPVAPHGLEVTVTLPRLS
ncbi:ATP-binding protein [Nisaea nitritireducens]|uniref:ATP-binding protein n=1 Tax=Nisaea nitritireducens TaxID=568392 RepID=UPI0018683D1A|nr:ATP-binding protein [Nisaea nitritireducens]